MSKLTDEEKWRLEHQRLHEKHRGHEAMHAEMVLILIVTLIVAQIVLVQWKQRHFRSYQVMSSTRHSIMLALLNREGIVLLVYISNH